MKEFFTIVEVAERYGVPPGTVLRWVAAGELRAIRLPGGQHRIRQGDFEEFEHSRETGARPATSGL